jgi:hypothetical protein
MLGLWVVDVFCVPLGFVSRFQNRKGSSNGTQNNLFNSTAYSRLSRCPVCPVTF